MKALGTFVAFLVAASPAVADPVVRQATGVNAAAIAAAVTTFQNDVGNPNNGNTTPTQPGGRREVNWDGGGVAAPAQIFGNPQTNFAARGSIFTTPGTAMEQSGAPSPEFGEINPNYPGYFAPFSSPRLFAPLNSNIVDVHFFVPGSDVPAAVTGFGTVFTDVDLETSTKMEFYAPDNTLLWEGWVLPTPGNESLSFLGVSFNEGELVGRVRITSGNAALGPDETDAIDLVVMDDFIFGEPVATSGLTITPGTGQLFQTSAIDWTTGVVPPAGTSLVGGRVKYNGLDVTAPFAACIQFGTISGGGNTLRCSLPAGVFPAGEQTLQIELDLSNGTRLRNAVRWTILANTEP